MPNKSFRTKVVSVRLPNDVVDVIDRRCKGSKQYRTPSEYIRDRIIYDVSRKHKKSKK